MILFVLTIFALISIGIASPVKNLNSDILIELFNNKYSTEEALLDGLSFIESEDNEKAHLVSIFADVDQESKQLAKFFTESLPKLEKIRDGLIKDGKERASMVVAKSIETYRPFTSAEYVVLEKILAKFYRSHARALLYGFRKYLEDEKETIMEALNFIQSEDTDLEVVSLDNEVDEESKKLAQFFTESLPKLEKIRDDLKKDGYEKASMIVAKAIEQYRPYTSAEHVAVNKNKAKFYAFVTIAVLHLNQKYLEQ